MSHIFQFTNDLIGLEYTARNSIEIGLKKQILIAVVVFNSMNATLLCMNSTETTHQRNTKSILHGRLEILVASR